MYKALKVIITPIISIVFILALYLFIMIYYLDFNFMYIVFILYLLNWLTIIIIFFSKRRAEVKLSWIFVVSIFLFIGMFAYFLYGRDYRHKRKNQKYNIYSNININYENQETTKFNLETLYKINSELAELFHINNLVTNRGIYNNTKIKILEPEESWINIINDISKAKKYILITYFIIENGEALNLLTEMLIKKHNEGVIIYFLYDHVGSYFKKIDKVVKKMRNAGIYISKFEKFLIPFVKNSVSYRNHRKDIIIDGIIGYTGGVNIGDSYLNLKHKLGKINDLHCCIKGEAIKSLELIFMNDWYFTTKTEISFIKINMHNNFIKNKENLITQNQENFIQIVDSGPIKPLSLHKNIILKMINLSKKRIWLSTPYFIPPEDLINELKLAGKLGKDVRILIPGKSDKLFILSLTKLYASQLLKYNVKIFVMYNSFNHAKFSIFDDDVSIISTTNLDNRSFFVDYQTMVLNYNKQLNLDFTKKFEQFFKLSYELTEDELKSWNIFYRGTINFLKFASPVL